MSVDSVRHDFYFNAENLNLHNATHIVMGGQKNSIDSPDIFGNPSPKRRYEGCISNLNIGFQMILFQFFKITVSSIIFKTLRKWAMMEKLSVSLLRYPVVDLNYHCGSTNISSYNMFHFLLLLYQSFNKWYTLRTRLKYIIMFFLASKISSNYYVPLPDTNLDQFYLISMYFIYRGVKMVIEETNTYHAQRRNLLYNIGAFFQHFFFAYDLLFYTTKKFTL
uniref:Uncharacterized protein n=1 Tax=Heterorhabditis bacteriophora TaxID=37862 RepID=A0A1I7XBZ2_HETBA